MFGDRYINDKGFAKLVLFPFFGHVCRFGNARRSTES